MKTKTIKFKNTYATLSDCIVQNRQLTILYQLKNSDLKIHRLTIKYPQDSTKFALFRIVEEPLIANLFKNKKIFSVNAIDNEVVLELTAQSKNFQRKLIRFLNEHLELADAISYYEEN